jgi:uncharacterized membrane protein
MATLSGPTPDAGPEQPEGLAPVFEAARLSLYWGFRLSAALLIAGCALSLARSEPLQTEAQPFQQLPSSLLDAEAAALIDLSILAIMTTPVVAVLAVAAGFFRAGDRRFGALSLVVLAILGVSVVLAMSR